MEHVREADFARQLPPHSLLLPGAPSPTLAGFRFLWFPLFSGSVARSRTVLEGVLGLRRYVYLVYMICYVFLRIVLEGSALVTDRCLKTLFYSGSSHVIRFIVLGEASELQSGHRLFIRSVFVEFGHHLTSQSIIHGHSRPERSWSTLYA